MRPVAADFDEDAVPSFMARAGDDEVLSAISLCSGLLERLITDSSLAIMIIPSVPFARERETYL